MDYRCPHCGGTAKPVPGAEDTIKCEGEVHCQFMGSEDDFEHVEAETIEQPPEQKKVPRLRHGMTLKIGNENFKVIRPGKKLNVILKYMG